MRSGRRNKKQESRYNAFLITTAVAFGAIVTAHYWAIVTIAVTLIGLSYLAGRNHAKRHSAPIRRTATKQTPKPKRLRVVRISAECAGNDHLICTDKRCQCSRCDHPALKSYPLPADRIPTPDKVPF